MHFPFPLFKASGTRLAHHLARLLARRGDPARRTGRAPSALHGMLVQREG